MVLIGINPDILKRATERERERGALKIIHEDSFYPEIQKNI